MTPIFNLISSRESSPPDAAPTDVSRSTPPSDDPDASVPRIAPVSGNTSAYSGYRWEDRSHRLQDRRPNSSGPDYSRFILSSCRAGSLLNRARVVSDEAGEDIFQPEQIRALMGLLEYPEDTSAIVLDQDRREPGHICIEIADRRWAIAMIERLEDRCEREVKNEQGCEVLVASLREAVHEKTAWENFIDTLPVGTGFFAPVSLRAPCTTQLGALTNSECEEGA